MKKPKLYTSSLFFSSVFAFALFAIPLFAFVTSASAADDTTSPDSSNSKTDSSRAKKKKTQKSTTDSTTPSTTASDTPSKVPVKKDERSQQIDEMITNNNLRAESGSTSRWSIASQFNYLGGTVTSPFGELRPNIAATSATTDRTDIDGSISVKYNINVKNSLMVGFGIRWIAPFTWRPLSNYAGTRFDAINPYIQYQYIYKWFGVQSVLQVQFMQWTQADQTAVGYSFAPSISQDNMYEIGKTGLSVGAAVGISANTFFLHNPSLADSQSVLSLSFVPEIEYQLTEKVNLRTVVNALIFEHYNNGQWVHDTAQESFGVGISVTRDIFLYPNIQFLPQNFAWDLTNVGLTATINVF